jgi:hypothetical protein
MWISVLFKVSILCALVGILKKLLQIIICWYSKGAQTFQKSRCHLKILSARRATWSMFATEDPQILRAIVQYLVAMRPGDRELYIAVVVCPANTHVYTEDCRQIIFFSYSVRYNRLTPSHVTHCFNPLVQFPTYDHQSSGSSSITTTHPSIHLHMGTA